VDDATGRAVRGLDRRRDACPLYFARHAERECNALALASRAACGGSQSQRKEDQDHPDPAARVEGSRIGLLTGMLVRSGNDACQALVPNAAAIAS
jgi:hypothetical protein